jgi:hypothetical protein
MVFSPLPPPVPSLPLALVEVSATGSLRKLGRRHSFFETSIADPDTATLLKDIGLQASSMFPPLYATPTSGRGAGRSLQVWPSYAARSARVAMRGALA